MLTAVDRVGQVRHAEFALGSSLALDSSAQGTSDMEAVGKVIHHSAKTYLRSARISST